MAVSFDRLAGVYDSTRWSGVPPEVMKNLLKAMKEVFAGCGTILDVGVGTGRFAVYLNDSGFEVVGIDVSLSMMGKAREKRVRSLVRADAHHLPFRDRVFDGAIMIHVLHLVSDWVQVVGEVARVTGRVIVSVDIDVHEEIDSFDRRKSSVSWDVPAEVNDRIIQRLHSENPEKIVRRREIVEVVGWDPEQLRNFAARERSRT